MTPEEKLKNDYERFKEFWKVNESLERQGVFGFIKTENKNDFLEFFSYFEDKI